jgi:hypothetical protein
MDARYLATMVMSGFQGKADIAIGRNNATFEPYALGSVAMVLAYQHPFLRSAF